MYKTWICIFLIAFVGCRNSSKANGVIDSAGHFPSPGGKYVLTVSVTAQSTVSYSVAQAASDQQLLSGSAGSSHQRWFFFWDNQDNLWAYSSDIGGCVWRVSDSHFIQVPLNVAMKSMQLPNEVKNALPEAMRKQLEP